MIAATILLTIAITTLIWSIIVGIVTNNGYRFLCPGLIMTVVISFVGIAILFITPTNNDVKEGNAHYVKQTHIEILNGDTVNNYKTYQIVWNQNTK